MEKVESFQNRQTGMWEVRLAETVAEPTKDAAERKARIILAAYREAAELLNEPIQIMNKAITEECNCWQEKAERLEAEAEILKKKYQEFAAGKAKYYHDIWCSAHRDLPMGCDGCSCTAGVEIKRLRGALDLMLQAFDPSHAGACSQECFDSSDGHGY